MNNEKLIRLPKEVERIDLEKTTFMEDSTSNIELPMVDEKLELVNEQYKEIASNKIPQLQGQLDSIEQKKLDKNGIVTMANMGQDVKESMTGGSVAVVADNTVLNSNVVDNQIGKNKINNTITNLLYNDSNSMANDMLGASTANNNTRFNVDAVPKDGVLTSLTLKVSANGVAKIRLWSRIAGDVFKEEGVFTLNVKSGLNTYVYGVDFPVINVKKDWYISYWSDVAFPKYDNLAKASYNFTGEATGSSVSFYTSNITLCIKYTVSTTILDTINNNISDINILKNTIGTLKPQSKTLFASDFKTIPQDFVYSGFTINNGLNMSGVGGWDKVAYWNKRTTLDKCTIRAKVKINDVTSKFAIIRKPLMGVSGCVFEIDCGNKKINFYNPWNGTTTQPTIASSSNITFDFVSGRDYLVTLTKNAGLSTLVITDLVTNLSVSKAIDNNSSGSGWDCAGVMFNGGNIVVSKFEYISNMPINPRLLIIGDSFIEGNNLWNQQGGYASRYSQKISDKLNGNCVICGRGGEDTAGGLIRAEIDIMKFKPQYVLIALGTNDYTFATWKSNIEALIDMVKSLGAIPILTTFAPRSDRQPFLNQANTEVKNKGYMYLDIAKAMTVNNDEVTPNSSLYLADNVHPNVDGHNNIFTRSLVDIAEVFD